MAQPNRMNFRKCSKGGGGGSFSIQKFILHILDLFKGLFFGRFPKTMQYNFTKMRRLKAVWNVSENSSDLVPPAFPYFFNWTKCRIRFIYITFNSKRKNAWKKVPLEEGGGCRCSEALWQIT